MSFFVRSLHVVSVSLLLGGAVLVFLLLRMRRQGQDAAERDSLLIDLMRAYEWVSWGSLGLIAMTGVGNLGHFGTGLPLSGSEWGRKLVFKLALVFILLGLFTARTLAVGIVQVADAKLRRSVWPALQSLYGGTAVLTAATLGLAVALVHF